MAASAGRNVRVKIGATEVAGARTDGMQSARGHIDITDKDDDAVRKLLDNDLASMTKTLTCTGILKTDALILWDEDETDVLKTMDFAIAGIGTWQGPFGLAAFEVTGEYEGETTFSATFESGGAVAFVPA